MKGTGTQTDPYILETADDLYEMETLGGEDKYCRLGADIDFDDTPYAENFVPIPVNWSYLDGAGHKIRNINAIEPDNLVNVFKVMVNGSIEITGLMLENVIMKGTVVTLFKSSGGVSAAINLSECTLILKVAHFSSSIITGENCLLHGTGITVSTDLTVISLWGTFKKGYALLYGGTVKRTQFVIDIVTHDAGDYMILESSLFRSVKIADSWLMGSIYCDASGTNHVIHMADKLTTISNFYQALSVTGLNQLYWSNKFYSTCFYDKTLMGDAVYASRDSISNIFYGLTTDQCKDPEYLTSIGFMCERSSNGV